MSLFSENYSPDFAEIESLQLAVRQGLRVEEVPVRMLERAGGSSFLTPLRSAFFIFKGLIVLLVGHVPAAPGRGRAMSALSGSGGWLSPSASTRRSTSPRRRGSSPRSWRSPSCC